MSDLLVLTDEQKKILQNTAIACLGIDYVFGQKAADLGMEPAKIKGIDCSGYVRYLYHKAGLVIPDGSGEQYINTLPVDVPAVGDVVFKSINGHIDHIGGIFEAENGLILVSEASGSLGHVVIRDLWSFKTFPKNVDFAGVRRFIADKVKAVSL